VADAAAVLVEGDNVFGDGVVVAGAGLVLLDNVGSGVVVLDIDGAGVVVLDIVCVAVVLLDVVNFAVVVAVVVALDTTVHADSVLLACCAYPCQLGIEVSLILSESPVCTTTTLVLVGLLLLLHTAGDEKSPGQFTQVESVVAPNTDEYVSAAQSVHAPLPVITLYLPATHKAHVSPSGPVDPALHVQ
jgi:hypothetical protein